jgi:MFS transporter, OFA family, oxalate/formate antiporter
MAMGILTMGFGMGGLILGGIAGYLIESLGWASAFQFLALISLIICVTGGLMARFPAVGWTQADMARPQAASGPSDEMIKTKEWW